MGLWNLSRTQFHSCLSAEKGKALIKEGYRKGIRLFDAAYSYGDAESILAGAMRDIRKDDWGIISKVMPLPSARRKAETTLKRIRRDYIDILLLHWPSEDESLFSSLHLLETLKAEGKALSIGVSNFPLPLLRQAISDFDITFHERPLSLIWTRDWPEEQKLGLKTLAYAPLGMGLLSGKYRSIDDIKDSRRKLSALSTPLFGELLRAIGYNAAIALSWVYAEKPFGVVSGYSCKEELGILDRITSLSENERTELRDLADAITSAESSDNIFSHNWRGNACTTG